MTLIDTYLVTRPDRTIIKNRGRGAALMLCGKETPMLGK